MEEITSLANLIKEYGVSGVVVTFLIWNHFVAPRLKKRNGDYVSFKEVKDLKEQITEHLKKEALEDIRMGIIENELQHLKEGFKKVDENFENIFGMISKLKDYMIQEGYGKGKSH